MTWDWSYAWSCLPLLWQAGLITVLATVIGGALAAVGGLPWAVLLRSDHAWVRRPADAVLQVVRNTPLLVQLYLLYYGLPHLGWSPSPLVIGIAGLALHYAAYAAEVYRAGFSAVPAGQTEAARVLGLSRWQRFRHVLVPQAIPPVLPALGNLVVALFKDTPVLSAITVIELLTRAKLLGAESFRYLEPMTLVGVWFLIASLVAAWPLTRLEHRLRRIPT
ncbi:MAG: ectoine/hydroxyectoine ABC transporter permease subunit EhuD [Planctomycetes bacterium]|nr:ectoine/hydroxyectoine ABC transporter permease subunit EhuD [Planctomycetota bacterium]